MNSINKPMTILEDRQVSVQAKLAAAWTQGQRIIILGTMPQR